MTKKEKQQFFDNFKKDIRASVEKMWRDAIIYGHGFISMDAEGNLNNISAREAYKLGKYIKDNCINIDDAKGNKPR